MKKSILVVEDDTYLRKFIFKSLNNAGYECTEAPSGKIAIQNLKERYFDLIIMDLDLGDCNGSEIISSIRIQGIKTPVIVVSTFNNLNIKVDLFNTGCDDYITKPFYIDELLARVRRLLVRIMDNNITKEVLEEDIIEFNGLILNCKTSTIEKNGEDINITKKIFDMLLYFIKNPNRIISKEQLLSRLWSDLDILPDNTLTVHIHKLRSIIEEDPSNPKFLITKRGFGFIFNLEI